MTRSQREDFPDDGFLYWRLEDKRRFSPSIGRFKGEALAKGHSLYPHTPRCPSSPPVYASTSSSSHCPFLWDDQLHVKRKSSGACMTDCMSGSSGIDPPHNFTSWVCRQSYFFFLSHIQPYYTPSRLRRPSLPKVTSLKVQHSGEGVLLLVKGNHTNWQRVLYLSVTSPEKLLRLVLKLLHVVAVSLSDSITVFASSFQSFPPLLSISVSPVIGFE